MAAGAEVCGEAAVLEMDSPAAAAAAVEPSSPKIEIPTCGNEVENCVKDSGLNPDMDAKSELQMKEIVNMLKKLELNPLAKEFFPSSYHQSHNGAHNLQMNHRRV